MGNNDADGLPIGSYISLSEFFTWALDGVARDDTAIKHLVAQQCERDAEIWGDHFGPGWLTHLLELIRTGHEAYPKRDASSDQTHDINQRSFAAAQRWLERHGGSAEDALVEVEQEKARRQDRDPRHHALELLLFDRASTGKVIVKARQWNDAKNCAASEYQPIPADFFLRPCRFFYSVFHGQSELVRWTNDGTPNWLLDSVFNRNDPPVSYVEAKISREDAIALRAAFCAGENCKTPESLCRLWLIELMKTPQDRAQQTRDKMRLAALSKFSGLKPEHFKRAWKLARADADPSWHRPGRPPKKSCD